MCRDFGIAFVIWIWAQLNNVIYCNKLRANHFIRLVFSLFLCAVFLDLIVFLGLKRCLCVCIWDCMCCLWCEWWNTEKKEKKKKIHRSSTFHKISIYVVYITGIHSEVLCVIFYVVRILETSTHCISPRFKSSNNCYSNSNYRHAIQFDFSLFVCVCICAWLVPWCILYLTAPYACFSKICLMPLHF